MRSATAATRWSRLGRHQEALASYHDALDLQPDHVEALCNRGIVLHKLRRFDDALASYEDALGLRRTIPRRSSVAAPRCTTKGNSMMR